ncbi:ubiquitin binding protein [Daedalea quercina L-15889]|uniref:Vacuolar protein sorting-associated protein 27 n=1 Tax=Daedalea quercina L-15889 TaxID=1314783 RepID=A0A165PZM1_9APHY|nr:ubiquitin binding protein [Daedalea quercina L-15889]
MTSYLSSLIWGTSQVDDAVDKATSELLPSGTEDIALNLEISDQIRSKSVSPKDAMRALKRRLNHKNPNVQLLALGLTDTCIKNGGDQFLQDVATREFMDNLVSILKMPALNHDVKNKILRLVQNWALAFEGKPSLGYVGEVYRTLQYDGFTFPPRDPAATSSAMVDTQTAPEWIDSDVCLRCRTPFTFTNRKHHCRNCGQVFDQQCSSKTLPLPHFGITQEVRVCDTCYNKLHKRATKYVLHPSVMPHRNHRPSQSVSSSRHRVARDLYDAELQRAIQLSLEEVGAAGGRRPGYVPSPSPWQSSEPPLVDRRTHPYASPPLPQGEEDDPDLRAAIEASLREANAPRPSAPVVIDTPSQEQPAPYGNGYGIPSSYPPSAVTPKPKAPTLPNYDLEPLEADAIMTFNQTVDQVQAQGITDVSRYPAVTELYDKANALRPKLAMSLSDTGRKEQLLQEMHEKLSQAVKLYDNLLTQQVSRPTWQSASTNYQQANGYAPQYHPVEPVYNQWNVPQAQQPMSPGPSQASQPTYLGREQSVTNGTYVMSQATEVQPQPMYQPSYQPSQMVTSPQPYSNSPYTQATPASPAPVTIPQYGAPPAPPSAVPYPPPTPAQPAALPAMSPPQTTSAPAPPIASASSGAPGFQSTLTRSHTVASHARPSDQQTQTYIVRHNTMSHPPEQLQQLQQLSAPPPQLPNFPTVPTDSPQAYAGYGHSISVEPERKEALLIDL